MRVERITTLTKGPGALRQGVHLPAQDHRLHLVTEGGEAAGAYEGEEARGF
jgi:hypothetical protein